ncbi:sensor histidine kinase [Paeniglutamicibacter psychrophenolicus]|uniref:sensor histidine kinase n=1 Tax=Paeniglutamicibacter psychrophenolicus TaxID=257454 RepID=UPI00277E93E2|nr:sensor histidine kinase [Paeniglutamicibacter psychrophenolicus]MDQ0095947.1 signal transduction histidine kinase [Paeniglutamicibacter psychrophenolicus]
MTPHRTIDKWIRENPNKVDLIFGLGIWLVFGFLAGIMLGVSGNGWTMFVLGSLQTLPLIWRRRRPAPAAGIIVIAHLIQVVVTSELLPSQIAVPITVYTLAAFGKRWESFAGLAAGFVGALLASVRVGVWAGGNSLEGMVLNFIGLGLVVLVAWTFGDLARTRRLTLQTLEDRARRLETEREQERALAAADERNHIAREMHDIVAHSLSVIIAQSDGARYASEHNPEIARETLATIAQTGRSSLQEMRRLLGVLRGGDEASTRPLPTLADVPELLETTRKSGLEISYTPEGTARRSLPAGAELTAYRVLQEALTNVLKHAGPATTAKVSLTWNSKGLQLAISDNGRGAGALGTSDVGQGLLGMAERVALYDGRVRAEPKAGGGFHVDVFIPYTED